jgi:hypothetical protein
MQTYYQTIKPDLDVKQYHRTALVELASDLKTPRDIFDSDFSEPNFEYRPIAIMQASVELEYHCSVGHDRQEEYKKWDNARKRYVTEKKTVTDWSPLSGFFNSTEYGYCDNCDTPDPSKDEMIKNFLLSIDNNPTLDPNKIENGLPIPGEVNENAIKCMKRICTSDSEERCKNSISGRIDNFSARATVTPKKLHSICAPTYRMDYTYDGKKYTHKSFAAGNHLTYGTSPDATDKLKGITDKAEKPLFITVLSLSVLTIMMSMIASKIWLPLIFALLTTAAFVTERIFRKRIVEILYKDSFSRKMEAVAMLLSKFGYTPLSDAEKVAFQFESRKKEVKKSFKEIFFLTFYILSMAIFAFTHLFFLVYILFLPAIIGGIIFLAIRVFKMFRQK